MRKSFYVELCDMRGGIYQSSPSRSLAGTSMTRGLSMIRADRLPFSTMPMIQDWYPSCFSISLQKAAACSRGRAIKSPPVKNSNTICYWCFLFTKQIKFWIVIHLPEVSAEWPWIRPNMLPQALLTAAIFAIIGKLWMTNPTSFFCTRAKFWAWPSRPKPVTSVAPCALYLCMSRAA